ncbi:DUF5672 family protein [Rhodoferax sp. WC2427]|uniref:DUF5672 family protein n=1 Tax=Rhodoferax sp. WC2427 TaxID=3234144 RepID=UPI003467EB8A
MTISTAASVAIVVPTYKARLSALESFSLRHSLAQLAPGRQVFFVGPASLDFTRYAAEFPDITLRRYDDASFATVQGYSRLLLSPAFYQGFAEFEFMLILQTDAILLRDDLDLWCGRPYDYVGAPWPDAFELFVNLGKFDGPRGRKVQAHVGNGGLSLRRIRKSVALLHEFPEAVTVFEQAGSSEDLFFGVMGSLSLDFVLPNELTAATFALELQAERYLGLNPQSPPMGGHAWWKYDPAFWLSLLGPQGAAALPHLSALA